MFTFTKKTFITKKTINPNIFYNRLISLYGTSFYAGLDCHQSNLNNIEDFTDLFNYLIIHHIHICLKMY